MPLSTPSIQLGGNAFIIFISRIRSIALPPGMTWEYLYYYQDHQVNTWKFDVLCNFIYLFFFFGETVALTSTPEFHRIQVKSRH